MKIKLSKKQWQWMGLQAGWLKEAAKLEEGGTDMGDVFGDPDTQEDSKGNIAPFAPVLGQSEGELNWIASIDNGTFKSYMVNSIRSTIENAVAEEPTMQKAMKILANYPSLFWLNINWGIASAMTDAARANRIAKKNGTPLSYADLDYQEIMKGMPSEALAGRMEGDVGVMDKVISKLPPNTNRNEMVDLMDGLIDGAKMTAEVYLDRIGRP